MSQEYVCALDQGTTSSRAVLFDREGQIAGMAQREFTQHFPKPGWVEHDPSAIWESQRGVFKEVLAETGLRAGDLACIGITNQRETTLVWDRHTGEPVCNAIVWQDRRTAPLCEALKKDGHADYIRENTGLVIDAYFSGTKVKWILDNVPGARERADNGDLLFGTVDAWLIWKLTQGKVHATDVSNASRTMLYNIRRMAWDSTLLDALGIPDSMLPEVRDSSGDFGALQYDHAEIPIRGVAGDQQAALFGQACFDEGMAKNTYGTGCFLLMNTGERFCPSPSGLLTTVAWRIGGKVTYALEGSVFIGGAAIQWLRDGLKIIDSAPASEQLARRARETEQLYFVPAFVGLGAPYWDMYARGAILGLTRDTGREEIARTALESIAYQTRDVLDAMQKDAGKKVDVLRVDGGASANDFLMQFQSDILDVAIERPVVTESTALGAACLAGLASGVWTLEDIRAHHQTAHTFTPNIEGGTRERLYAGWQKAVKRTMHWVDEE